MSRYTFHINFYDLAFLGTIFIGLTFVLQLWFTKRPNRIANRFLALALATIVLWMVWVLGIDVRLGAYIPCWSWLPLQFSLALGPLIFFYVLKITRPAYKFRWKDLLHFTPLLLQQIVLVLQVYQSVRTGAATYDTLIFKQLNLILQLLVAISVITYLYLSHRLIEHFYQRQKFNYGDRYRYELRWLRNLLTGFGLFWLLWIPYTATDYFCYHYKLSVNAYYPLYLLLAVTGIWVAAIAFLRQEVDVLVAPAPSLKPPLQGEMKQRGIWLRKAMQAGLYYQDPKLNLSLLSQKLELTTHELSWIINTVIKKSFNDFINEYRVREVIGKMQDPANDHLTLMGIAYDSGFNSPSTFHRTFKEITGKTPAEYKKELPSYNLTYRSRFAAVISYRETSPMWSPDKLNCNYMLKNYLKIAWRNAIKNRAHSVISLVSLVLGLTFFCLIMLWVKDELSYDKQVPSAGRVFRIESNLTLKDGSSSSMSAVGWPVGRVLPAEYAEVEALTYMSDWSPIISFNGNKFYESAMYADKNFFSVLGYKLSEGNPVTALSEPYSIVISQQLKQKYFGNTQALGKTLMLNDTVPYKITGVLAGHPTPSHLKFDLLGSFASRLVGDPKGWEQEFTQGWFDVNVYNYVKLKAGVNPDAFNTKIEDLVLRDGKAIVKATGFKSKLFLRPVKDIYLYSGMSTGSGPVGSIKSLKLFAAIGFFILIIACLNFINLTTARSVERAKEIGVKKVLGSGRTKLIWQFLIESALFCACALLISIMAVLVLLPLFNSFTGKLISFDMLFSAGNVVLMLAIVVLIIPLAGFYPALVLSAYQPVKVLKGSFSHSGSGNLLRKILVVGQFSLSILFILSTIIIWKQMRFMQNQSLGFDKDKIVLINTTKVPWRLRNGKAEAFKNAALRHAGIIAMSGNAAVPGHMGWGAQFAYPEGKTKDQGLVVEYIPVDNDYTKTLGLKFTAGQGFAVDNIEDQKQNLVINETAVKAFGWGTAENAIGKKLATSGKDGKVIGVLKDYHQHGLQTQINSVVLGIGQSINMFAVHYNAPNPRTVIKAVKSEWKRIFQGYEFDYKFMDEDFQEQYAAEEKFETLFCLAAFLSILIACLGLLGLAIYTAQKRIKEIGIRKVLGASVYSITKMLSMDFLQLVFIAILVASPLGWYLMDQWLQGFAYRITIYWWLFPLAGFMAIVIALFTISFNAIEAALSNPVRSLRSE